MGLPDHYKILGITSSADAAAIKGAFRERAKKTHPDATKDPLSAEQFRNVVLAYEILSDPTKRRVYDEMRRSSQRVVQPAPMTTRHAQWSADASKVADQYARMSFEEMLTAAFKSAGKVAAHASVWTGSMLIWIAFLAVVGLPLAFWASKFHTSLGMIVAFLCFLPVLAYQDISESGKFDAMRPWRKLWSAICGRDEKK